MTVVNIGVTARRTADGRSYTERSLIGIGMTVDCIRCQHDTGGVMYLRHIAAGGKVIVAAAIGIAGTQTGVVIAVADKTAVRNPVVSAGIDLIGKAASALVFSQQPLWRIPHKSYDIVRHLRIGVHRFFNLL